MSHEPAVVTPRDISSTSSLLKASAIAIGVAALLLTFVVLPAEYGIDPTGVGSRLGLTAMNTTTEVPEADAAAEDAALTASDASAVSVLDALWKSDTPFKVDEMSLTLQPNEGAEIKALMEAGDRIVFAWTTEGGVVNFDMHGEALNAPKDEYTSYWKGRNEASANGAFTAPFAGTHGWYWRNRGSTPVTVRVKASGYYEKLFKP